MKTFKRKAIAYFDVKTKKLVGLEIIEKENNNKLYELIV